MRRKESNMEMVTTDPSEVVIVEYSSGNVKELPAVPATRGDLIEYLDAVLLYVDSCHEDCVEGHLWECELGR